MIRIPHLQSIKNLRSLEISPSIENCCFKYNLRVIVEYGSSPVVILHARDLEHGYHNTFYMDEDYFTVNYAIVKWMKEKLHSLDKGLKPGRKKK